MTVATQNYELFRSHCTKYLNYRYDFSKPSRPIALLFLSISFYLLLSFFSSLLQLFLYFLSPPSRYFPSDAAHSISDWCYLFYASNMIQPLQFACLHYISYYYFVVSSFPTFTSIPASTNTVYGGGFPNFAASVHACACFTSCSIHSRLQYCVVECYFCLPVYLLFFDNRKFTSYSLTYLWFTSTPNSTELYGSSKVLQFSFVFRVFSLFSQRMCSLFA